MTSFGDDVSEMLPLHLLDDATVEALLGGGPVPPELEPLADAVQEIRSAAEQPVERTVELAERIGSGHFADLTPAAIPASRPPENRRQRLAAMSVRARAVTGAAVMITGFSGVTAAGALPDAAQERVESIIESVSPITFPDPVRPADEVADDGGREPGDNTGDGPRQPDNAGYRGDGNPQRPGNQPSVLPGPGANPPEAPPGEPDDTPGTSPKAPLVKPVGPPGDRPASSPGKPGDPGEPADIPAGEGQVPPGKPDPSRGRPETPPGDGSPETTRDQPADPPASPPGGVPEDRPAGPNR